MLRTAFLREGLLFRPGRSARGRGGSADAARPHNGNEKDKTRKRRRRFTNDIINTVKTSETRDPKAVLGAQTTPRTLEMTTKNVFT